MITLNRFLAAAIAVTAVPLPAQAIDASPATDIHVEPSVPGVRFGSVQLRTGVRLRYAEQGDPAGEAVILLHGLADSWYSFSRNLPYLPSTLHVFALDQRGHGESGKPSSGFTMADFADDVIAFLDAMGIEHATIVGHSMGSFVAQRVALVAPERVARLVLIGSATTAHNEVLLGLRDELARLPDPIPETFLRDFQYGTVHVPLPSAFMQRVVAESGKVPARAFRGALDGLLASAHAARLSTLSTPTLIIWGDQDALFANTEQLALRSAIPGSKLEIYRGIGHAAHWEAPERFARDLMAFLGQQKQLD